MISLKGCVFVFLKLKVIHTNTYTSFIFIFNQICSQFLKSSLLIRCKSWIHFIVQNYVIRVDQTHQSKCVYEWVTNMRIWKNNCSEPIYSLLSASSIAPVCFLHSIDLVWPAIWEDFNSTIFLKSFYCFNMAQINIEFIS